MNSSSQPQISAAVSAAAERVSKRCDELARCTDEPVQLTRLFCSTAMQSAHQQLKGWMRSAAMESEVDAVGNMIGRYEFPGNKSVFLIGSHLDTVVNAGRFDGMLGVLLGLAAVEVLSEAKINLPFDLHVVAFSEEEGVRYRFPFIGSLGMVGELENADLARIDDDGISMRLALQEFGCGDDVSSASYASAITGKQLIGFMEPHIEQAVVLQEADVPVGVVSAIAGQSRASIWFEGVAGHAGTVPHDRRRDALAAAAELILKIEALGQTTDGLFATVGNVIASPGLSNVISGRTELRLDLRHEFDENRLQAFEKVKLLIDEVAQSREVTGSMFNIQHSPAVPMDGVLSQHLSSAIQKCGLVPESGSVPKSMVSGAGHDALVISRLAPSCMLFVRCRDGVSHHPDEYVSPEDVSSALDVMVNALIDIAQPNPS